MEKIDLIIVDNEPDSVETRQEWLNKSGFNVQSVTTLTGAWECISDYYSENNQTPLVLLDIMMPTTDDKDWLPKHEIDSGKLSAPVAGLVFAEKLKLKYSKINIVWHSVRHRSEAPVSAKIKSLGYKIVQKDLQNKIVFIKEIKEAFNV